ncbi:MAG: transglycosylase SLT domain-containing protein [Bacteroidota bacterium]
METSAIRLYLCVILVFIAFNINANNTTSTFFTDPELDEEAIMARIKEMKSDVIPPRYDAVVRSYLHTYTIRLRDHSERVLGDRLVYFPMFEQKLAENDVPTDMKYLSIVESALEPTAVSRVGATGLWQFMPETGKYFGLEISKLVDERRDPEASTEAAIVFLKRLYKRFGSWELALAGYNSGGGRVSRAVKRGRSKNFWRIRRYLPRETRNYVPAFVAATYLVKYYEEHDLTPQYPSLDMQFTETTPVFDTITFYEIAQITGLPLETIEMLNPAYLQKKIPGREMGYPLVLPSRVMPAFKDYQDALRPDYKVRARIQSIPVYVRSTNLKVNQEYRKSFYYPFEGELLESVANKTGCSLHQLRAWNAAIESDTLNEKQEIVFYSAKKIRRFRLNETIPYFEFIPNPLPPVNVKRDEGDKIILLKKRLIERDGFIWYRLEEESTPFLVSQKLSFIEYNTILRLNDLKSNKVFPKGHELKIQRLK